MAGGGETEKEVSAWTVDSTRDWIDDIHEMQDRVDMWRDRLYDEREQHRREMNALMEQGRREAAALREQMDAQQFAASQQALVVAQQATAEKFSGFPEQYALKGETNTKLETIERAIAGLVAASQTRAGSETALVTQRTERRLSTNALLGIGLFAIAVLTLLAPWITGK